MLNSIFPFSQSDWANPQRPRLRSEYAGNRAVLLHALNKKHDPPLGWRKSGAKVVPGPCLAVTARKINSAILSPFPQEPICRTPFDAEDD
jgi:hypothetical protein